MQTVTPIRMIISCTLSVFTTDICPPIAVYAITIIEVMTNISLLLFPRANVIREFIAKHADADVPLRDWYKRTTKANWNTFADIKQTFNTVDYVGNDRYVFNIKGNDYRLIVVIRFAKERVYIRFIGTHAEYDKITDIKNI